MHAVHSHSGSCRARMPWKHLLHDAAGYLDGVMLGASVQHCWPLVLHYKHHECWHFCRPAKSGISAVARHTAPV